MAQSVPVASPPLGFHSAHANGSASSHTTLKTHLRVDIDHTKKETMSARKQKQRPRRRKPESLGESLRTWLLEHQIGWTANLLILHSLAHILLPRARETTRPFFQLSYYNPASGLYRRGPEDLYFVCYWTVVFTGLRAACLSWVFFPLARLAGIRKHKTQVRFAEQAWLVVYYTASFALGMHLFMGSKYWMNFRELWTDFPVREITGLFKWYYLVQFAFWLQQIVVVNIEERRKDHWQMFAHHIVTCMLIFFSYGFYQTRAGNVILCLMDGVDIVLSLAKDLKYAGFQTSCDIMFGVFILSWFALRHVVYLMLCWSVHFDVLDVMTYGCYSSTTGEYLRTSPDSSEQPGGTEVLKEVTQPYSNPGGEICYNYHIRHAFLVLLFALQAICVVWFVMIIRVAYRVIRGQGADDSRSDDEDDGEEEDESEQLDTKAPLIAAQSLPAAAQPVEEYVGVEGLSFKRKGGPAVVSRQPGTSSSLAAIGDKKEILNRIGCDTKST